MITIRLLLLMTSPMFGSTLIRPSPLGKFSPESIYKGLPSSVPIGLSDAFAADAIKTMQWAAFLKRNQLDPAGLSVVVARLRETFQETGIF